MNSSNMPVIDSFLSESAGRRRHLLPRWMGFFCWAFMILAILSIACLLLGISGMHFKLAVFGIQSSGPLSTDTLIIISLLLLKGIVGWSLWFEKDYAVVLGLADAIATIIICITTMVAANQLQSWITVNSNFRMELILLVPYLIKLLMIRGEWSTLK